MFNQRISPIFAAAERTPRNIYSLVAGIRALANLATEREALALIGRQYDEQKLA